MRIEDIRQVSVIGAGLMGHGIAQVFAQAGYEVTLRDVKQEILTDAMIRMNENLKKLSSASIIPDEEIETILARVKPTLDMKEALGNTDFMVEVVTENLELKKTIFRDASRLSPEDAILATNTSGLPIAGVAEVTNRASKVVGTHFWNPPFLLRAVEIVKGAGTSDETVRVTHELLKRVGKKPVVVNKDIPGQIGIRILYAMLREAMSLVENEIASPEDIDSVVREALGSRLPVVGVLELADLSGNDLVLAVSNRLFKDLDNSPEPSKFLQKMVADGRTGIKNSRGFYEWSPDRISALIQRRDEHLLRLLRTGS